MWPLLRPYKKNLPQKSLKNLKQQQRHKNIIIKSKTNYNNNKSYLKENKQQEIRITYGRKKCCKKNKNQRKCACLKQLLWFLMVFLTQSCVFFSIGQRTHVLRTKEHFRKSYASQLSSPTHAKSSKQNTIDFHVIE